MNVRKECRFCERFMHERDEDNIWPACQKGFRVDVESESCKKNTETKTITNGLRRIQKKST